MRLCGYLVVKTWALPIAAALFSAVAELLVNICTVSRRISKKVQVRTKVASDQQYEDALGIKINDLG